MKNPVAKHARTYNKSVVMRDKKKDYTRKGKSNFKKTIKDYFLMVITLHMVCRSPSKSILTIQLRCQCCSNNFYKLSLSSNS